MSDLNESRKKLVAALGSELSERYFTMLKEWFMFKNELTQIQFHIAAQKLFKTEEQNELHEAFIRGIFRKVKSRHKQPTDLVFETADPTDYMSHNAPAPPPANYSDRSAAMEFFLPDSGFIATKIDIHAWENGLDGADENVAGYMIQACQAFIKNIITAMITKKRSYKVREGNFQHGFGFPVPDPLIRNSANILDDTQSPKVSVMTEEDSFVPAYRPTLENIEQQTAFAYACGKRGPATGKLTVKLLYETLRDNPNIVGLHSINSVLLLKIGLQLEE